MCIGNTGRHTGLQQHFSSKGHDDPFKPGICFFARQKIETIEDFQRVASRISQWLIHIGYQC
ncbi:hypothetical protein D3C80_2234690 [compost metagenome]